MILNKNNVFNNKIHFKAFEVEKKKSFRSKYHLAFPAIQTFYQWQFRKISNEVRRGEEKQSFACVDMLNKRQPRVGTFLTEVLYSSKITLKIIPR